jgi:hypothetical protein
VDNELTEWFQVTVGVRQSCSLSPYLFNLLLEAVMQEALKGATAGVNINGQLINNLRFADDIDLIAQTQEQLQELTDRVDETSKQYGLAINIAKTKVMAISKDKPMQVKINLRNEQLEQVKEFIYLGGLITEDGQCVADVKRRIGLASAVMGRLGKLWKSKNISIKTKVKMYETLVVPVLVYGAECWCLKKEDEHRINVAEMNWLRRLLKVTRWDRIRNDVIRERLGQQETVVNKICKRRLKWFGHVSRMDTTRLPRMAMHSYIEGRRTRGRPRKRWMDNVIEDVESYQLDLRGNTFGS